MNANNVIPYGVLVHEVANAGGVEAYRAAQQQLINTVKRNSFNEGVEAERNRLLPWLIISGVTAVGLGVKQLAPVVKKKFDSHRENREKLRKEAITAEKILVDNDEITQVGIQEMSGLSTRISYLKDVLSILKGIEIELYPASKIREYGVATCRTPKKEHEENEPYIGIYNGNTNDFYKIALEIDPSGTSCIMELIGTKIEVTKENTEILYCIFTLLHEAGHWYDYKSRPDEYTIDIEAVDNSISFDLSMDAARAYRKRSIENRADQFALDHIIEAWKEVNEKIFHGLLSVSRIYK